MSRLPCRKLIVRCGTVRTGTAAAFCLLLVLLYYDKYAYFPGETYLGRILDYLTSDSYANENFTRPAFSQIWEEYFGGKPYWVDCGSMLEGNEEVLDHYNESGRIVIAEPPNLSMACEDIQARVIGSQRFRRIRHPYAIARNVFHHYFVQEVLLAFSYSPYNTYCYAVDSKANETLFNSLMNLSSCLPNVVVVQKRYAFNSAGHYQDAAHLDCIKALLSYSGWEYVMLLQSHDVIIKTPQEISTVIEILQGMPLIDLQDLIRKRVPRAKAWTPRALNLFKPTARFSLRQEITKIAIRKSTHQCFLSREFVTEITKKLDFTFILNLFNNKRIYGVDEMLFPTIIGAAFMNIPGQIENWCTPPTSLRYAHWENLEEGPCKSQRKRHDVCMLGTEYLPRLSTVQALFANKIWPSVDFGTVMCLGEMLHNRTVNSVNNIDKKFFTSLPQVREMQEKRYGIFKADDFICDS